MKTLIIYYSLTGNTHTIAQTIAQEIGADLARLKPKKDINPKGFMKYFWGGRQVITKQKPEVEPLNFNPIDYELIILGTPVWASNFVPAFRTFFDQQKFQGKKIALFASAGNQPGQTFKNMQKELPNNQILDHICFKQPKNENQKQNNTSQAMEWVNKIIRM